MVRKSAPRPLKGGGAGRWRRERHKGESPPQRPAEEAKKRGAVAGLRCCYDGRSHSVWRGEGRCGSGRAGRVSRAPPRRLPSARLLAPIVAVLSLFVAACSRFVSCRVVMRCHWVSPPCFLIVYAPAMRAVAYYALSGGGGRMRVSRFGAWDCLTCRGGVRVNFVLL